MLILSLCLRVLLEGLEKDNAKKEALALSLKYKFVTPLTSLVVTKPQDEEMQVAHKPKEEKKTNRLSSGITKTSGSSQNGWIFIYLFCYQSNLYAIIFC